MLAAWLHTNIISIIIKANSFRNLTSEEVQYRLKNYYKFAIIRKPMERLVSGYKNKFLPPFDIRKKKQFPNQAKAFILNLFNTKRLHDWIAAGNFSQDIHPTFILIFSDSCQSIRWMPTMSISCLLCHSVTPVLFITTFSSIWRPWTTTYLLSWSS